MTMTREEAIRELREDKALYETDNCRAGDGSPDGDLLEALDMAIEALSEPINCVKCKHYYETEDDTDVHGHCRMDTAHTNPMNKDAWVIPISLVALTVAVVGLLAEIHFLFL